MPHEEGMDKICRTISYMGNSFVILRPGIALVMYSHADVSTVMKAAADVLTAYLDFIPNGAITTSYQPGPDEYTPGQWVPFDAAARANLLRTLQSGQVNAEEDGYGYVLTSAPEGQVGLYGARLSAIDFEAEEFEDDQDDDNEEDDQDDADHETSLLRLEFPSDFRNAAEIVSLVEFVERVSALFPFCTGNAGMSFNHTIAFVPEARKEIYKLLPRFLGFDSAYDAAKLEMRGKSPSAHWLNLLDADLMKALGGEACVRSNLDGCEVRSVKGGLIVRAAKYPPLVDVNRGGLDIGLLPVVSRALKPVRFSEPSFVGLPDEVSGRAWLERFDQLAARDWDNR